MKRQLALGIALGIVVASISVEAQLGGFLKKKAREAISGKEAEAPPTPAPTPETKTPDTSAPAPTRGGDRTAAAAPAEKIAVSPLEESELPLRESAREVLRERVNARPNGDWDQLPSLPDAAVAAAYALGDSAQVALVETVGTALKALVMSAAFLAEHDKYIKDEHRGVDHGLKGVIGIEQALKKNDLKAIEAMQARETIAMGVEQVGMMPGELLKTEFDRDLAKWKVEAATPRPRQQAKFQKLVARAQPLEGLAGNDEKFTRGYAVLKSIENDGPDTEEAVYAIHTRVTQEREQLAYDDHNLKGQLKRHLTTFVTIAAIVNFDAKTVEKDEKLLFVNPADEKQGALWKACFRAGEAPTAAALKLARAWLAEL